MGSLELPLAPEAGILGRGLRPSSGQWGKGAILGGAAEGFLQPTKARGWYILLAFGSPCVEDMAQKLVQLACDHKGQAKGQRSIC